MKKLRKTPTWCATTLMRFARLPHLAILAQRIESFTSTLAQELKSLQERLKTDSQTTISSDNECANVALRHHHGLQMSEIAAPAFDAAA